MEIIGALLMFYAGLGLLILGIKELRRKYARRRKIRERVLARL